MTDQSAVLPLGLCGEHLACRIVWKFKDAWPDVADGTFQVLVRPSGYDAAYAAANVSADFDAGILSWTVTDTETAVPGFSSVQFVVLQGGRIIKQLTLRGYVGASLSGGDDTVELPVASAVNALLEEAARLAGNAGSSAEAAAASAAEAAGCIAAVQDAAAQGLADLSAQGAEILADCAEKAGQAAEYAGKSELYSKLAEQSAATHGFYHFEIDDNGHLIFYRTANVQDITFALQDGRLIATYDY